LKPFAIPNYSSKQLLGLQENTGLINIEREVRLLRTMHVHYLTSALSNTLPRGFVSLDASRPWICYWISHSLYLLGKEATFLYPRILSTFARIQNNRYATNRSAPSSSSSSSFPSSSSASSSASSSTSNTFYSSSSSSSSASSPSASYPSSSYNRLVSGGFGGGPQQISQCAPNYAAVLCLCTIGSEAALALVDRPAMYMYFLRMKQPNGSFSIHEDGEVRVIWCGCGVDVVWVYCISVVSLLCSLTLFSRCVRVAIASRSPRVRSALAFAFISLCFLCVRFAFGILGFRSVR
jgi:prenyltransferase beta subunit